MGDIKQIKNISWGTVGSVVVGLTVFGGLIYAIKRAPSNVVTKPLKEGAAAIG